MNEGELYLGPPGTGKTQNLSNLVRKCIEDGIPPDRIACVSFTKRAAIESKERVGRDWGIAESDLPYFQTLHSMAFHAGGYKTADVIGPKDLAEIGNAVGISFSRKKSSNAETDFDVLGVSQGDLYLNMYHLARSRCMDLEEMYRRSANYDLSWPELKRLVKSYKDYKKTRGKIDFTDMIENFVLRGEPLSIDALFVDEAQDLSTLQWRMIRVLRNGPRIQIFTGDDDQAIMGFQGADVPEFQHCSRNKHVLSRSYRLPQKVYDMAQSIVQRIPDRERKVWHPKREEGNVFWHNHIGHVPLEEGEWCLLARTNRIASQYASMLREEGWVFSRFGKPSIPVKTYEAILDWEEWMKGNPLNIAQIKNLYGFLDVGSGFERGFGPRSSALLAVNEEDTFTMERARKSLGLTSKDGRWHETLGKIDTDTKHYILNSLRRGDNVKNPRIKISTIHSMKGGECQNVLVIPELSYAAYKEYQREPSTEHRVFYVAVTRTKESLHIMEPIQTMGSEKFYDL